MQEIADELMKEIPGCLGVGIYDYKAKTELAVVTLLPNYDSKAGTEAYSHIANELIKAVSMLPEEKVGKFKNLVFLSGKAIALGYLVEDIPVVLVAAIPKGGNIGLARAIMTRYLPKIKEVYKG